MFARSKARVEAKIENLKDLCTSPRTQDGVRVANADFVLMIIVVILIVFFVAVGPRKMPMVHLVIFSLGVLALSAPGRMRMVPMIYTFLADRFKWPSTFEQACATERVTRAAERAAKNGVATPQAEATPAALVTAPAPGPDLDDHGKQVLRVFFNKMTHEERHANVDRVLEALATKGVTFPDLDEIESREERFGVAINELRRMAKRHNLMGDSV